MTFKTKTSTVTLSSDVVFDPCSEVKTEEGAETLVLHIHDFKKDQLRVQVNNQGVLKVSGERPLGEDGKRKTRFLKETTIPQGCDLNNIRAKFIAGQLHVIMPIKAPTPPENQQDKPSTSTTPLSSLQSKITEKLKENASHFDEQKLKAIKGSSGGNGILAGMTTSKDELKDKVLGLGNSIAKLPAEKKVAVGWGVAVVALVAIGAYVAYSYGSSSSSSSPPSHIEE